MAVAVQDLRGSPEWWRKRLLARLIARAAMTQEYQRFFDGQQPLAFASQKFRETFGSRYGRLPANFMPLVVDAERERLVVQGFRFRNAAQGDDATWRIWQENQLDAESQIAHEIALVKGEAYTLITPGRDGAPVVTIEDPSEVILETAPGNRRIRVAALKVFTDDGGYARAFLLLPDAVVQWRSRNPRTDETTSTLEGIQWEVVPTDDGDISIPNPLGVVPVVPLLNHPRRDGTGRSEIAPVMGNQHAINKLRFDALVASEYVAFPQRWATNIDVPVDPDTGKEVRPFRPGVDLVWIARRPSAEETAEYGDNPPNPAFGQFPSANLSPYIDMIREEVGQMASISRTPYHYLLGEPTSVPPSGESLKSSEAPLVKKVGAQAIHFGEGWEETMRVALIAAGQAAKARTDGETIWADPETRNEAARTDSIIKQYQVGLLPDAVALEELGYSQQQIARILELKVTNPTPEQVPQEPEGS